MFRIGKLYIYILENIEKYTLRQKDRFKFNLKKRKK